MVLPFTFTSPASISRSASRREATPARDSILAMRSPSGAVLGFSAGFARPFAVDALAGAFFGLSCSVMAFPACCGGVC